MNDPNPTRRKNLSDRTNDDTPLLVLRPVWIRWAAILSLPLVQLITTPIAAAAFFMLASWLSEELSVPLSVPHMTVIGACLGFFAVPVVAYFAVRRTYAKTEYRFYRDRLEYAEGFWTIEHKTIRLDRIIEASMRQGIVQKAYGIGTIRLATAATGQPYGKARSGITLADIQQPEVAYALIQEVLDKQARNGKKQPS